MMNKARWVFRSLQCPNCFEFFSPGELLFRCVNQEASSCLPIPDEVLGRFLDPMRPERMGVRAPVIPCPAPGLISRYRLRETMKCPACSATSDHAICPRCHLSVPGGLDQTMQRVVPVVGLRAVGKTFFIHSLEKVLRRAMPAMNMSFDLATEFTRQRIALLDSFVHNQNRVPDGTQPHSADPSNRQPLIYRMQGSGESQLDKPFSLVTYDLAGEDFTSRDLMRQHRNLFVHCSGLIILLDPTRVPALRHLHRQAPGEQAESPSAQEEMVANLADALRQGGSRRRKLNTPIAIVITKGDRIEDQLCFNLALTDTIEPAAEALEARSAQIAQSLRGWGMGNLVLTVEQHFKTACFFVTSSIGHDPEDGNLAYHLQPQHVHDPVIWLMSKWGVLKTTVEAK